MSINTPYETRRNLIIWDIRDSRFATLSVPELYFFRITFLSLQPQANWWWSFLGTISQVNTCNSPCVLDRGNGAALPIHHPPAGGEVQTILDHTPHRGILVASTDYLDGLRLCYSVFVCLLLYCLVLCIPSFLTGRNQTGCGLSTLGGSLIWAPSSPGHDTQLDYSKVTSADRSFTTITITGGQSCHTAHCEGSGSSLTVAG